jgi:serine/threonine protein kinase
MATGLRGPSVAGYVIEDVAGRGGMGVVYRARDIALDRTVAVKVIAPELARDPKFRARFIRESRATAGVDHPNVIPVYEANEDDQGQLYIVMRFVDGHDLGKMLHEQGALEPGLAAELTAQAAAALDAAHLRGLVHRDVKPGNVLVTAGDRPHVYLTDFGLVKWEGSTTPLTTTDGWIGTPDYIAPEQVDGGTEDARTDVYALGCVLFAALTGRPPFADLPRLRKAGAHLSERPPLLRDINRSVPRAFETVMTRALAKDPEDRFQSAGELGAAALRAARSAEVAEPRTEVTVRQPRDERTGRTVKLSSAAPRGRRWLSSAAPPPRARGPQPAASPPPRRRRLGRIMVGTGLLALAGLAAAVALGVFSRDSGAPAAAKRHHRAVPKPPPVAQGFFTVRCTSTSCTQEGHRVQTPIDGGDCNVAGNLGVWARIDKEGPPLFGCMLDNTLVRTAPVAMPDVLGGRVDYVQDYLDGLGIEHDTLGGGILGILDESSYQVCASSPRPDNTLEVGHKAQLYADHSC